MSAEALTEQSLISLIASGIAPAIPPSAFSPLIVTDVVVLLVPTEHPDMMTDVYFPLYPMIPPTRVPISASPVPLAESA